MARLGEASQILYAREELWRRAIERLAGRVEQLLARPATPATQATQYNAYGVSMVLYPAHVDLLTDRTA
eukprot:7868703-Lingulodinium_polyedra.AAC.1